MMCACHSATNEKFGSQSDCACALVCAQTSVMCLELLKEQERCE